MEMETVTRFEMFYGLVWFVDQQESWEDVGCLDKCQESISAFEDRERTNKKRKRNEASSGKTG